MSGESAIVRALDKFKSDYAWDKSLSTPVLDKAQETPRAAIQHTSSSSVLEQFVTNSKK